MIICERPAPGPQRPHREHRLVGPAGLSALQITSLVARILTEVNVVGENNLKLLAVTLEVEAIEKEEKYSRLSIVRDEICQRLKRAFL